MAREEKLRRVTADILPDNLSMQRISEKLGFRLHLSAEDSMVKAEMDL